MLTINQRANLRESNSYAQSGFTLIEFMLVVTVSGVLLGLAIPGFSQLILNNRLILTSNALITSMALARTRAMISGYDVYICELVKPDKCNEQRNYNADWSQGWLVFIDNNWNHDLDNKDTILEIHQRDNQQIAVVFNQRGRLRFRGDGSARSAGFYLCHRSAFKHIYLLHTGRARLSNTINANQRQQCLKKLLQ